MCVGHVVPVFIKVVVRRQLLAACTEERPCNSTDAGNDCIVYVMLGVACAVCVCVCVLR